MKLYVASLGCDKNRVDTEKMLSVFLAREPGTCLTEDPEEAEIALVNTCSFIGPAKEESIEAILELAAYKETGKLKRLLVTGCLVDRYRAEIRKELPEVDEVFAVQDYVSGLDKEVRRVETGEGYSRYLKIAEGCDKSCTYCVIPKIRGHYRSIPMEQLLEEAALLADAGAKELCLVAQETTLYGTDLYGKKALGTLLERLSALPGIEWLRVLYCYPEEIDEALLSVMRDNPKVCHYLDIPVQHASDRILSRMGRRTNADALRRIIGHIRETIPDIALRTTLLTGFPGEGEAEFEALCAFIREIHFDRLGVFPYSREEGTAAARMPMQVPERQKMKRLDRLMRMQQEIAFEKARAQAGQRMRVLLTGFDPDRGLYVGRSYMDAPEIDALVYVDMGNERNHMAGEMVDALIVGADGYDLIGRRERGDEPAK